MRYAKHHAALWTALALVAGCNVEPDVQARRSAQSSDAADTGPSTVAVEGEIPPPAVGQDTLAKLETPEGRAELEARGWFKDDSGATVRYDSVRGQWDKQDTPPTAGLQLTGATYYSTWETEPKSGLGLTYAAGAVFRPSTYMVYTANRYNYGVSAVRPTVRAPVTNTVLQYGSGNVAVNQATSVNYGSGVSASYAPAVQRPVSSTTVQSGQGNVSINNNNGASVVCLGYNGTMIPNPSGYGYTYQQGPCGASAAFGPAANVNIINSTNGSNGSFNNNLGNLQNGATTVANTPVYNNGGNTTVQSGQGNVSINNNNGASAVCLGYNYTSIPLANGGWRYIQGPCGATAAFGPAANINIVTTSNTASNSFNTTSNAGHATSTGYTPVQPGEQRAGTFTDAVAAFREEAIQECGHLPAYYWLSANGQKTVRC